MPVLFSLACVIYTALLSGIACSYTFWVNDEQLLHILIGIFVFINLFAGTGFCRSRRFRQRICQHGAALLIAFELSLVVAVVYHIVMATRTLPENYPVFVRSVVACLVVEMIVFWNGIICVYLTSYQLGLWQRIVGILCGFVPILNLVMMNKILWTASREVHLEGKKEKLNRSRKKQQLCKTKYPILLVHGVFFRDMKYFNYWGRIPRELKYHGATIYYGNHQSARAVADSAQELTDRIKQIVEGTGCEKVNIIAHSKGGLDCRYAIAKLGMGQYVASLTTVNTPHRGCIFADHLLKEITPEYQEEVAKRYNNTMKKIGDQSPDLLAAVNDLTASACEKFNQEITYVPENIYCQSVGSVQKKAGGGRFPLNLSYHIVKMYDGENDGLVSTSAFPWGEKYTLLTPTGEQGISHGDVTDFSRRNLKDFDVREFYVQMVNGLQKRGL